eukprot:COSAG01_NODE_31135_length_603_cov_0.894841_2_plen_96_part_01
MGTQGCHWHPALDNGDPMREGRHYAEFTWVAGSDVMVGVARAGLDVAQTTPYQHGECWLWYNQSGPINANQGPNGVNGWPGQQKFAVGDTVGVLLD